MKFMKKGNTIILVTHEEYIAEPCRAYFKNKDGLIEADVPVVNRYIPKMRVEVN